MRSAEAMTPASDPPDGSQASPQGLGRLLAASLQHAALALVFLVYPLAVARQIGLSESDAAAFLAGTLMAAGVSTVFHWLPPPWGSGSLAIEIPTPVYLPVLMIAGSLGGLPMIAGVCLICGLAEIVFARGFRFLRSLFPPEVCGIALILLGASIARPALQGFIGTAGTPGGLPSFIIASGTLATMVAVTLSGRKTLKLYTLVIGALTGVALSALFGVWDEATLETLAQTSAFGLPSLKLAMPVFDLALVPLAIVMGVVVAVDNVGVLVSIQRQRDAEWRRIDPAHAAGGIQASAVGDVLSGVLGGMPTGVSSANIGLAYATGVLSRTVPLVVGAVMVLAAFSPKLILAMSLVPAPVVSGVVVFAASYMMVSGMELLLARILNERRMLTIGLSLVVGLSPDAFNLLIEHADVPAMLQPILQSQLAMALMTAIGLNTVFRIGVVDRAALTIGPDQSDVYPPIREFLLGVGRQWAVRREVVDNAVRAGADLMEALAMIDARGEPVNLAVRRDDAWFELAISYHGEALRFPSGPLPIDELEGDRAALARYAAYLASAVPDEFSARQSAGRQTVTLRFAN